ncbi:hypothetical protein [Allostreptomyces psammosilenae]|uniref:Uncharacterized protein n=1 Tax=Allostreptomyces psammosilenae TaxID=1892865 RepID=A0A852ZZJ1_9ACTN|nr:hypothetical protein [Allostreptomyces psammosilenae]NYI07569.1 hypothetical protein [Allostreptomyces psammosilenae]
MSTPVRPVRVDQRMVPVDGQSLGWLVMTAAQVGKYAYLNGDSRSASHVLDLATELGAALAQADGSPEGSVPVGVLEELADLAEATADHVERDGWSLCDCGEPHGEDNVDAGAAAVMRAHAALARALCAPGAAGSQERG